MSWSSFALGYLCGLVTVPMLQQCATAAKGTKAWSQPLIKAHAP